MADIVSPDVRSRMMSGIRGKDTKPEIIVRRGLHRKGFRYRLHDRSLPGRPDLVFPKHRAVVFVNGCFWHGHGCQMFKWPKTRDAFWRGKIEGNVERDGRSKQSLVDEGWRTATIWECALRGPQKLPVDEAIDRVAKWLVSDSLQIEVEGQ